MRPLRVGVYDLYWSTLGGGEQVAGTIAEHLARRGHEVALLGPDRPDVERTRERLGVDLSACSYREVHDDAEASHASNLYDLFVNSTYLSTAPSHAGISWYYVHFPQPPLRWRDHARHRFGVAGVRLLRLPPRLPARLREVRAGFDRRVRRTEFLPTYRRYLANSRFTAGWVNRLWDATADVVYPPVRAEFPAVEKRSTILNVGRFFDPARGHSKRQLELIDAFGRLDLSGWCLALAGGCDAANRDYALAARRAARDRPIRVHINARGSVVQQLFGESSIYWHAGGYLADPKRHPEQFEHFGISVVEAMAAGAVPVVFGAAGPAEIVEHGVSGFHWHDLDGLIYRTRVLATEPEVRAAMAAAARRRASDFSTIAFTAALDRLLSSDLTAPMSSTRGEV
jgi:glycosyltransferase involved in cell wall biosynthesis